MIVGCTIEELQAKIGMPEFSIWLAYRKKYGAMNPVRRYDTGSALIASMISRAHGGKATAMDFMPYPAKEPVEDDPDKLMALLMADKTVKRGR
jgi:hypothetical protein